MTDEKQRITNANTELTPKVSFEGRALTFDYPSVEIGIAEYEEGPTGCTVFNFPNGGTCVADIRGGLPGTSQSSPAEDGPIAAICFAGGSLYGLEAAAGVSAAIFEWIAYSGVRRVRGAIIYDFFRDNWIYPDKALGYAAAKAVRPGIFPLGTRGAGRYAGCGPGFDGTQAEPAGQGAAFRQVDSIKVVVFTVINALGAIVDRQGQVVRGHRDPKTGKRYHFAELLDRRLTQNESTELPGGNTTLTLVVTNQKMDISSLRQFANQVHSSMARAIQPFHTGDDGDVLYAVSTGEVESDVLDRTALGVVASELAWDAVLSCFDSAD